VRLSRRFTPPPAGRSARRPTATSSRKQRAAIKGTVTATEPATAGPSEATPTPTPPVMVPKTSVTPTQSA
jgi:hypothetical protein